LLRKFSAAEVCHQLLRKNSCAEKEDGWHITKKKKACIGLFIFEA
jgi:hypothetical protein